MLAVGLMSGTSADGVTAALVRFAGRSAQVVRMATRPYPPALRAKVLAASTLRTPELSLLNAELGEAFAAAALGVIKGARPAVIGSHGQTVWHGPDDRPGHTLQLGEPSIIAERTGVTVVADFRPRDLAAGGQGAPLVPAFDEFLFGAGPLRALQNIGGIGNVSVVGRGGIKTAFDTGPGNCLLDAAMRLAKAGTMDKGGRLAAKGWADARAVEKLLKLPFFARKPPKSLERTAFGETLLLKEFGRPTRKTLPDTLATLTLLTARSIEDSYRRFVLPKHKVRECVVSGGGALNPTLMRALSARLGLLDIRVTTTADYGLPVMAKEAACFAWLAARAVAGKPNNCPSATGAHGPRVLGKIIPA